MTTIEAISDPTPVDLAAILAPLDAASRASGYAYTPEALTLVLRDEGGRIVGGAIGETYWGWLHVRILAVAEELRGQGAGRRLMEEMERLAAGRGCRHAWVDTFSFQARPFYERLGYRIFGTLPHYPDDQYRYFLAKAIGPPGTAG
ncbi:GNAT family N-acetyltransferase [Tundrisphaera sp. TA3]|uniref:GNAT family N-acetyltransferase n=1 Tax=Tundrisphaera sp. TA3 TaxID=3435775 RepID=UPI003EBAC542